MSGCTRALNAVVVVVVGTGVCYFDQLCVVDDLGHC